MPRRYKKKRVYRKKRRYKKKASFGRKLLGNSLAVTMIYNDQYSLDAGANPAVAVQIMRANSCFDPDETGAGHQPRGFDQLMTMYDHFVIVGSKITIKIPSGSTTHMVGIALKDSAALETTLINYQEGRNVVSKMMSPDAGGSTILSYGFSARKFLGRSHPLSDPDLKGSTIGNPLEEAFFHVFTGHPTALANPPVMVFDLTIQYRVVLLEPRNPVIS